jgi:hypothetical protein
MVRSLVALGLFDRSKPSEPDSAAIKGQISEFNEKMAATPACVWLNTADNALTPTPTDKASAANSTRWPNPRITAKPVKHGRATPSSTKKKDISLLSAAVGGC